MFAIARQQLSEEGRVLPGGFLYYSDILSTPEIVTRMGEIMATEYYAAAPDFVLTMETKGIPVAFATANALGVPLVILKKQQTADSLKTEVWQTEVVSYTKDTSYRLTLAKNYISDEDHVLIIDDFLANGEAATGAIRLIRKAHATVAGLGVLIEKAFQPGHEKLESQGIHVYAQASIQAFEDGKVVF